ncbi:MAG TPA: pyridoxamine 5'-phosphate oxidase family protein [Alphaproteobacteria bacterium]
MAIDMNGDMTVINRAYEDGVPCLLGTADPDGNPQISPKGSMMVYDATRLAYWERSHRTAIANLKANPKVVVYYRNPAKTEQFPRGAVWRFYGTARVVADGAERDKVYERVVPPEQEKDPDRKGAAVLITVDRITDLAGKVIQEA